ncbi:MAG: hypothetical protein RXQ77_02900 [Candidatus Nanopusillus sp.]
MDMAIRGNNKEYIALSNNITDLVLFENLKPIISIKTMKGNNIKNTYNKG